jgi:hypothetical protein
VGPPSLMVRRALIIASAASGGCILESLMRQSSIARALVEAHGEEPKSDEFASELKGLHGGVPCYPQIYPSGERAVPGALGACWTRMSEL